MKWIEAYFAMQVIIPVLCVSLLAVGILTYILAEIVFKPMQIKFRFRRAYWQGKLARKQNKSEDDNPYPSINKTFSSIGVFSSSNAFYREWIRGYHSIDEKKDVR